MVRALPVLAASAVLIFVVSFCYLYLAHTPPLQPDIPVLIEIPLSERAQSPERNNLQEEQEDEDDEFAEEEE